MYTDAREVAELTRESKRVVFEMCGKEYGEERKEIWVKIRHAARTEEPVFGHDGPRLIFLSFRNLAWSRRCAGNDHYSTAKSVRLLETF